MAKGGQGAISVTYDPEVDALAIDLDSNPVGQLTTRRLTEDHRIDFDRRGHLISLEVLNASRYYDRSLLERLPDPVEWLTLREAAAESGLSTSTLRTQLNTGRLIGVKRGRDWLVAGHELWNYLENRARQGRRPSNAEVIPFRKRHVSERVRSGSAAAQRASGRMMTGRRGATGSRRATTPAATSRRGGQRSKGKPAVGRRRSPRP